MRPSDLKTKIFLDSGDPAETREVLSILGFLDGQTTNPSLIAKNPATAGKKFSKEELFGFYRKVVEKVSALIPQGSVSIEVYADTSTTWEDMLTQGREFYAWIPNAHIKYPTTTEGLKAAEASIKEKMRVNMTLVFSQEQAAAVYAATRGAKKGQVYVSPFVGRLDDIDERGMDLIANIIQMYKQGDGHVDVLTASVRSTEHIVEAMGLGTDILTAPLKVLNEAKSEILNPKFETNSNIQNSKLKSIPYRSIDLNKPWQEYNIQHDLTAKGLEKFATDWNSLIDQE
jgi:transaldolase